jgi:hypothetical protein
VCVCVCVCVSMACYYCNKLLEIFVIMRFTAQSEKENKETEERETSVTVKHKL